MMGAALAVEPAAPGISLAQIQETLGLKPVKRPLPGDIAVVVKDEKPIAFFRTSSVRPADPTTAKVEEYDPSFVSKLFGYIVGNGRSEFYTSNGGPDSTIVLCLRPQDHYAWLVARGELLDLIPDITEAMPKSPESLSYEMDSRPGRGSHNFLA